MRMLEPTIICFFASLCRFVIHALCFNKLHIYNDFNPLYVTYIISNLAQTKLTKKGEKGETMAAKV